MNYSKSQRLLRINPKYIKLALKQTDFPENNRHPSSVLLLNFPSSPKEKSSIIYLDLLLIHIIIVI